MRISRLVAMLSMLATTHRVHGQQPARAGEPAQPAGPTHVMRTRDGSTMLGRVIGETADSVRFETAGGLLVFPRSRIAELRRINAEDIHGGQYWPPDPHSSRLFFGATGRTLKAGEKYLSDLYLFFLNGSVGVTDRVTLGGGFSVFPTSDFSTNVFYLTPQVGIVEAENFSLAVGALIGFAGKERGSAGLAYLAATSGGQRASLTYGAGWVYTNKDVQSKPVLMLGGTVRVARHLALMSENYAYTGDATGALVSFGVRIMGDKLSTDLAFWNYVGSKGFGIFPGVPWIGFAFKF